ncbi:hypothetical protein GCM10020254_05460 [Streptomyces goshikiensis]
MQLYVKRVFIMDDCEALMPNYLRFVKGVVDAHDLSLNVSRELLQHDRQIQGVRRRLVKKVLGALKDMQAKDAERYAKVWDQFGRALKEGLLEDTDNTEALLELVSAASTHDPAKTTTLREYVERMKDGQDTIYYLTGETRAMVENSPHMEAFAAKGYEVLILTDPIDEVWVDQVPAFDGHRLQSIAKGQVDLDESADGDKETDGDKAQREQDFAALLPWLNTTPVRPRQAGTPVITPDHLGSLHRRRRPRRHTHPGKRCTGPWASKCPPSKGSWNSTPTPPRHRPAHRTPRRRRGTRVEGDRRADLRQRAARRRRRPARPGPLHPAPHRPPDPHPVTTKAAQPRRGAAPRARKARGAWRWRRRARVRRCRRCATGSWRRRGHRRTRRPRTAARTRAEGCSRRSRCRACCESGSCSFVITSRGTWRSDERPVGPA